MSALTLSGRVLAVAVAVLVAAPPDSWAGRGGGGGRGGGSGLRGSMRSVNRNPGGTTSWSGGRSSGTTSRDISGNTSSRTTNVDTRSGRSGTAGKTIHTTGPDCGRSVITAGPVRSNFMNGVTQQ